MGSADLYPGRDSPELRRDLEALAADAASFRARYEGRLAALSGGELGEAVAEYERLQEIAGRIMSYAELMRAGNVADPAIAQFFQTMHERINAVATELLFFTLEINRLEDAVLDAKLADPALAHYRPWLRDVRAMRPYQLSDELEKMLLEKSVAGRAAWVRLFDETIAELRSRSAARELTEPEAMHLLSDPDGAVRREAALSIGEVLGRHGRVFALITNTLAKDKEIEDRWRKFPRPISSRNLSNFVEDEVVDALIAAVRASYPKTCRTAITGSRRAGSGSSNCRSGTATRRCRAMMTARSAGARRGHRAVGLPRVFAGAGGGRGEILRRRWIDAPVRPGKAPGAFAHPTVPSAHPYLLLNYQGRQRDVMTLAHELGHGVHQVLAARQGALMADTPLTLAETASVFGEMLTFRALWRARPTRRGARSCSPARSRTC